MEPGLSLIASLLLASIASSIIFGATTIQVWFYYQKFPNDSIVTSGSVAFLWILQLFQLGCSGQSLYWYLITLFSGTGSMLAESRWPARVPLLCSVFASFVVQSYLAQRIYQLSVSRVVTLLNIVLITIALAFGLVLAITKMRLSTRAWEGTPAWKLTSWAAANALTDVVLAGFMSVLLLRKRTGVARIDKAIGSMALYVINTGVLTSVASMLVVAFDLSHKASAVIFMYDTLGHMYTIALLAILHSRGKIQGSSRVSPGLQLDTWAVTAGPMIVSVARETRRASFHNGDAEIAVFTRMQSRYPFIETRIRPGLDSKPKSSMDTEDVGQIEEILMTDVVTPSL